MNEREDFLSKLTKLLHLHGVDFMVSGSLASSFYGDPRATNDIDVVIDTNIETLRAFVTDLPEDWYASWEAAAKALQNRSMFNVVDPNSGEKADLIIRKDRPYSVEEFKRRLPNRVLNTDVLMVTPEDSILSKLEWSLDSGSARHYQDALRVAILTGPKLDRDYLLKWAQDLGISEKLRALLDEVD